MPFGEITRGAGERPGIAGSAAGERQRLVVETGLLGGGKPFGLIARRRLHQVGQELTGGLVGVPPGHGPKSREVGARAVLSQAVALVRLFDHARREENLLADRIDLGVVRPGSTARLGVADRLCTFAHGGERLHRPTLVGPDGLDPKDVEDLPIALGPVQRAQARGGAVEEAPEVPVGTQRHPRDIHQAIRPCRGHLL